MRTSPQKFGPSFAPPGAWPDTFSPAAATPGAPRPAQRRPRAAPSAPRPGRRRPPPGRARRNREATPVRGKGRGGRDAADSGSPHLLGGAGVQHQHQAGGLAVEAEEAQQQAVDAEPAGADHQPVLMEEVQEDLALVLQQHRHGRRAERRMRTDRRALPPLRWRRPLPAPGAAVLRRGRFSRLEREVPEAKRRRAESGGGGGGSRGPPAWKMRWGRDLSARQAPTGARIEPHLLLVRGECVC